MTLSGSFPKSNGLFIMPISIPWRQTKQAMNDLTNNWRYNDF